MTFDLLLLSSRIALLVLIGSALGFALGWAWRSWVLKTRVSELESQLSSAQDDRLRLRQLVDAAGNETAQPDDARVKVLEEQCMSALHQRDEAERHAADLMNRQRALQEQLDRQQRDSVSRADYQQLEENLRITREEAARRKGEDEARISDLINQMEAAKASVPASHQETLSAKEQLLTTLQADLSNLKEALKHSEIALSLARSDAARLRESSGILKPEAAKIVTTPSPATTMQPQPLPDVAVEDFMDFPPAPPIPAREIMRLHAPPKPGPKPSLEEARKLLAGMRQERSLTHDVDEQEKLDRQIGSLTKAIETGEAAGDDTDDLTKIKGVKKVINQQLLDHGICTWKQIMDWSPEDITSFGELLMLKHRITKERWQKQAADLQAMKEVMRQKQ